MHDFSVFRTVHGPYDVPLDDAKPRFGQQRRKNRPRPCCHAPFLYGSTLDLRGISSVVQSETMVEAVDAAAAGAATPHALVVRAPERDHLHRRDVLYIPLDVPSAIPRRHIRQLAHFNGVPCFTHPQRPRKVAGSTTHCAPEVIWRSRLRVPVAVARPLRHAGAPRAAGTLELQ